MSQARRSGDRAAQSRAESKNVHEASASENLDYYDKVHRALSDKVAGSHKIIQGMELRVSSARRTIDTLRDLLSEVDKVVDMTKAPLALCQARMELRERRPLREQVRDDVELALEAEMSKLVDAERRLYRIQAKIKERLDVLVRAVDGLHFDIGQKMQALSVDEACLSKTQASFDKVKKTRSSSLSQTPRASQSNKLSNSLRSFRYTVDCHVQLKEGIRNERARQQEAERMNKAVQEKQHFSKGLDVESAQIIDQCRVVVNGSRSFTEAKLRERISEIQSCLQALIKELHEVDSSIEQTKRTISETEYHMNSLDEPIEYASTCASLRSHRVVSERIKDTCSTRLQEHRAAILKQKEELQAQSMNAKGQLRDLKDRRDRLKEDIHDKTRALEIDTECLRRHGGSRPTSARGQSVGMPSRRKSPGLIPRPQTAGTPRRPSSARVASRPRSANPNIHHSVGAIESAPEPLIVTVR